MNRPADALASRLRVAPHLLVVAAGVAFAAIALASFAPQVRAWGISHLAFFPVWLRLAVLAAIGLCFLPMVASPLHATLLAAARVLRGSGRIIPMLIVALGMGTVALMHQFQSATLLLGDAHLLAKSYTAAEYGYGTVIMRNPRAILRAERIAQGTTLLYYGAAQISKRLFDRPWLSGIRLLNCILGGAFVVLLLLLASRAQLEDLSRLWLLVLGLFGASIELFFGYLENYTPLFFLGALYILMSLRALRGNGAIHWPLALAVLATWLHVQAVLWFPSLVYLVLWHFERHSKARIERHAGKVLAILLPIAIALGYATASVRRFLLPAFGGEAHNGVLDLSHWLDVFNELLLLFPTLPWFVVLGALVSRWRQDLGNAVKVGSPQPWLTSQSEHVFLVMFIVPALVYLVFFKSEIGVARDWDLFSPLVLGLIPWSVSITQQASRLLPTSFLAPSSTPSLLTHITVGVAWVALNASGPRSAQRFESILGYEMAHRTYAYETLGNWYASVGRFDDAVRVIERATRISNNPRFQAMLGMYCAQAGQNERAIELLSAELAAHPDFLEARRWLAHALEEEREYRKLEEVLREGMRLHPQTTGFGMALSQTLVRLNRVEEAVQVVRHLDVSDLPPAAQRFKEELLERWDSLHPQDGSAAPVAPPAHPAPVDTTPG